MDVIVERNVSELLLKKRTLFAETKDSFLWMIYTFILVVVFFIIDSSVKKKGGGW